MIAINIKQLSRYNYLRNDDNRIRIFVGSENKMKLFNILKICQNI